MEKPGASVSDALREAPGVQVTQAGGLGAPATARLRGASSSQTPVYLAGVRINDEVGGAADISTVPSFMLQRVNVYRSHAPRRAAHGGMGGAIELVPLRPRTSELAVKGEVGSYSTRSLAGRMTMNDGGARLLVAGDVRASENDYGFDNTGGTLFQTSDDRSARLQNADTQGASLWIIGEKRLKGARLNLLFHHASREQGAPKLALVSSETARAEFSRDLFSLTSTMPMGEEGNEVSLSTRALFGATSLDDPQYELGLLTSKTRTPGEQIEQEVSFTEYAGPSLVLGQSLVIGYERLRRFERQGGADELAISGRRVWLQGAATGDLELGESARVHAFFSLRCSDTSVSELGVCQTFDPTGRIGLRWEERTWETYVNAGRYVRAPVLSELYGASILVRGNPSLVSESGIVSEVGLRFQVPRAGGPHYFWADASSFARYSHDLLTYVRTAQGYLHPVNRDNSRALGGELSVGAQPFGGLLLEGNVSLLDPRDTSPNRQVKNDILPYVSRATAFALAQYTWRASDLEVLHAVSLGARSVFQSSRYADPAGLGVIPGQTFMDLELGIVGGKEIFCLDARISNIFDSARFDVVGFPLPGRSIFLSLEIKTT